MLICSKFYVLIILPLFFFFRRVTELDLIFICNRHGLA